jgi:sulfite reductase alpha subunit-like flavoprotein
MADAEADVQLPHGLSVPVQPPGRSVLILYASETGTSKDIAEDLGQTARRLHWKQTVDEMNHVDLVC